MRWHLQCLCNSCVKEKTMGAMTQLSWTINSLFCFWKHQKWPLRANNDKQIWLKLPTCYKLILFVETSQFCHTLRLACAYNTVLKFTIQTPPGFSFSDTKTSSLRSDPICSLQWPPCPPRVCWTQWTAPTLQLEQFVHQGPEMFSISWLCWFEQFAILYSRIYSLCPNAVCHRLKIAIILWVLQRTYRINNVAFRAYNCF